MTEQIQHASRLKAFAIGSAVVASLLLVGVAVLVAVASNRDAIARIEQETLERRDAQCKGAERGHAAEVVDLERNYKFYIDPSPGLRDLLYNPFAVQGLRENIKEARRDGDGYGIFVSPFCDDPGVGEKEPDPVMPVQPPEVRALLQGGR